MGGMMWGFGGPPFWVWFLIVGGIIVLLRRGPFLFSRRTYRRKNKTDPKQKVISQENAILRIAEQNSGIVTVAKVSLELGKSLDETEGILNALVSKGHASMEVSAEGRIYYFFADFGDKPAKN